MAKLKKGMVTLSVVFLAVGLLFLLVTISLNANSQQTANTDLSNMGALNLRSDAAANAIATVSEYEAMNVTYYGNNISFNRNLSISTYSTDLMRLNQFLVSRNGVINLSINRTNSSRPQLIVRPQAIVVDNIPGRITFTPINSANSSGQILGYTILIKAGFPTPRLNWTNYSSLPPSDPNAMLFKISIQGTNGTMTNTSYLSKTAFSQVQLLNPANSSLATLRIGPPANVTLFYATPFSVEIIMALNSSSSVELGANIINATMSDGLRSSSKVILGES